MGEKYVTQRKHIFRIIFLEILRSCYSKMIFFYLKAHLVLVDVYGEDSFIPLFPEQMLDLFLGAVLLVEVSCVVAEESGQQTVDGVQGQILVIVAVHVVVQLDAQLIPGLVLKEGN